MFAGILTQNADTKTFILSVGSMTFDIARLDVTANEYKTADNHPDYQIEVRTPRGRTMRVGSMWSAVSERSKRRPSCSRRPSSWTISSTVGVGSINLE